MNSGFFRIAILNYCLMVFFFTVATVKVAYGHTDWTVPLNYGTSLCWGMAASIWHCRSNMS